MIGDSPATKLLVTAFGKLQMSVITAVENQDRSFSHRVYFIEHSAVVSQFHTENTGCFNH